MARYPARRAPHRRPRRRAARAQARADAVPGGLRPAPSDPSPQGRQQRRRVVGLVAAVVVLDLVVRLLGNRVGQFLLGEGASRDGDAGVLGAVVVRRGGDGVGTADALPPPGIAAVPVGGQPRRVELHPAVGEGALAVVAALARVGAALPSAVAGGLAALLPVVGLLVVGGGLAGAVLGPVRRCRGGLPPRQVPVERHERAGRDPEDQGTQDGAPAGPVPAQVRHDGARPGSFGWGGGGGDLRDAVHARLTSFWGVRARA